MEKFSSKLLPIILAYLTLITVIDCYARSNHGPHRGGPPKHSCIPPRPPPNRCHKDDKNQTIIDSTFVDETGNLTLGDELDCTVVNVTSINGEHSTCLGPIFTQPATDPTKYVFVPVSSTANCFSFQVKAESGAQILLSNTASVGDKFEIIIDKEGKVVIRDKTSLEVAASTIPDADIINGTDLRPFWVRYANGLVEVGKGTDSTPLVSYQVKSGDGFPASVNYVGLLSNGVAGEWIVDSDPICGVRVKPEMQMKTVCKVKKW